MSLPFDWDRVKAASNLRKHGVSFEEAVTAFDDPAFLLEPDVEHSWSEDRLILIGRSERQRVLFVVHVERLPIIRIISARLATPAEIERYEQQHPFRM